MKALLWDNALLLHSLLADTQFEHITTVENSKVPFSVLEMKPRQPQLYSQAQIPKIFF
jgi:hypothetical protein